MNKEQLLDILKRAVKTFLQAGIATLPVTLTMAQLGDKSYLYSLLIAFVSAGISAVTNFILTLLKKEL